MPKADSGVEVLGEGAAIPSPPARGLGEHCELPQRAKPDRPSPKGFPLFSALRIL